MIDQVEEKANIADDFTRDGTIDIRGQPTVRKKGGRWKACSFIVGYEVFERMAYYGIASNLVVYLTKKLHEGTVTSSNNVTNWGGTMWITSYFLCDINYVFLVLQGMLFLTFTVSLRALRSPSCPGVQDALCDKMASDFQVAIFYTALYIMRLELMAQSLTSQLWGQISSMTEPKEKIQKLSFFKWLIFSIFFGTLFANSFPIYAQDKVGFTIGYALLPLGLGFQS